MCGITGILDPSARAADKLELIALAMARTLAHRGPDDEGVWADEEARIALGFRRLAILDTSPRGRQPMTSHDGRYVIVFNGEIYNFMELRARLEGLGHTFRTGTDTEVILTAAIEWGARKLPERLQGMFAYALWDRAERVLYLVRDRVGIKPLYYGASHGSFLFGSELKAIGAFPGFRREVERDAIAPYLEYGYVATPRSIWKNILKLPPGTMICVDPRKLPTIPEPEPYWTPRDAYSNRIAREWRAEEVEEQTLDVLTRAIRRHMIADVPLGALLSGGIDSSTVVAVMSSLSPRKVKTYSIGFTDGWYNEAPYARRIADTLQTDHTELEVRPETALALIPKMPQVYDEPFADSSQIPTFLVSQLAKSGVTVALSGDGGDELFAGYNRYLHATRIWSRSRRLGRLRRPAAPAVEMVSRWMRRTGGWTRLAEAGPKVANILRSNSPDEVYQLMCRIGLADRLAPPGANKVAPARRQAFQPPDSLDAISRMQFMDTVSYLPDDILTKVDRASMAVSLELRVPLLDDEVVAFASSLPLSWKIRENKSKWPLRRILGRYIPDALFDRPKHGFGVPLAAWLRGPLRDWAESLLAPPIVRKTGLMDPTGVQEAWRGFMRGRRANHHQMWAILMLQAWSLADSTPSRIVAPLKPAPVLTV